MFSRHNGHLLICVRHELQTTCRHPNTSSSVRSLQMEHSSETTVSAGTLLVTGLCVGTFGLCAGTPANPRTAAI